MTSGSPRRTRPRRRAYLDSRPAEAAQAVITRFAQQAGQRTGLDLSRYRDLHAWSVRDLGAFWGTVADFFHLGLDGARTGALRGTAYRRVRI
jgi:acetoacetyl-CoA synthetase